MILNNNRFGYDPDQYDDEPSDYVNSENVYDADDLSRDSAEEFDRDDDDLDENEDLFDDDEEAEAEVDYDEDDSDVAGDDPINDDVTDYPGTEPAAQTQHKGNPVYIKDMPYIDHATPGVTSN